jgi:pimeloyl-ACP methyl ester carboxylesterase
MTAISANGVQLEYETFGKSSDPALVLVIGFGLQLTGWPTAFCEGLAERGFHVIRFDNRDTGLSTKFTDFGAPDLAAAMGQKMAGEVVTAPYTQADMATDVAALITGLGLDMAHVVGMSMGGAITQRLAINHPEVVRTATIMMSSTFDPSLPPMDPETQAVLFSAPENPDDPESVVALGLKIFATIRGSGFDYDPAAYADQIRSDLKRSPDLLGYGRNLLAGIAAPLFHEQAGEIVAPTLVLHGDEDPLFPVVVAENTARVIPGAVLKIIEGWGHEVFPPSLAPLMIRAIADHCSQY